MKAHPAVFPFDTGLPVRVCKVLAVSRSSHYYWLAQRPTKRTKENEAILVMISDSFTASDKRYGSPKIAPATRSDRGVQHACHAFTPSVLRLYLPLNKVQVVNK